MVYRRKARWQLALRSWKAEEAGAGRLVFMFHGRAAREWFDTRHESGADSMTVRDCQKAFASAAASDGVVLVPAGVPWLNGRGHLALPEEAAAARDVLASIFAALQAAQTSCYQSGAAALGRLPARGERDVRRGGRTPALHVVPIGDTRPVSQRGCPGIRHRGVPGLCRQWSAKAERNFAHKATVGFGPGGRPRQRAYNDALRDLVTPLMGHPPVIRTAAPDRDGAAAYERVRDRLREAIG